MTLEDKEGAILRQIAARRPENLPAIPCMAGWARKIAWKKETQPRLLLCEVISGPAEGIVSLLRSASSTREYELMVAALRVAGKHPHRA